MNTTKRRTVLGLALVAAGALAAWAYYLSLVPASHPDHDHGILNLDAGGRLMVETRTGKPRNLVGRPGHVLVVTFFSTSAPEAADELRGFARFQESVKTDPRIELIAIAHDRDFPSVDAWLAKNGIQLASPAAVTLDPEGDTTQKLNSKRPLETMFFNSEGKLSSQARGRLDWLGAAQGHVSQALGGGTIE
jgi:hypothetical protein